MLLWCVTVYISVVTPPLSRCRHAVSVDCLGVPEKWRSQEVSYGEQKLDMRKYYVGEPEQATGGSPKFWD